jgi:signal transduction histidine kinase
MLLAAMSHEIRTPLFSILGFLEMLMQEQEQMKSRHSDWVETAYSSGRHLLGTLNDILDSAKQEEGKMKLELSKLDARSLLKDLCKSLCATVARKDLEVRLSKSDLPYEAY